MELQLLLYNTVPILSEPLQLPEAWIGEELGQGQESASGGMETSHPHPHPRPRPAESGLGFRTLRKGIISKIWMDQWLQACIKSWTQLWTVCTKVSSCQNGRAHFEFKTSQGPGGAEGRA